MHNGTNKQKFPSLIEKVLSHSKQCVDNVFAGVWQGLKLNSLIQLSGFKKRTGVPVRDTVFLPEIPAPG